MLYTIVLIGALFGGSAHTKMQFITPEACQNVAAKLTAASDVKHVCVKSS